MDQAEWLDKAKQRFDFDRWPRPLELDADGTRPAVRGLALTVADETDEWTFERRAAYDNGYTDFFHVTGQPQQRALADVIECATHEAARLALLNLLSTAMAITLPRLDERIGEVAFIGHGDRPDAVSFVRLNIVIDVRSIGEEPVAVLSLAKLVDLQIQDQAITTPTGRPAT